LVEHIETMDAHWNVGSSALHSVQDGNHEVLLSVVEVLAGELYGSEMREHIGEFLEDVPCHIASPDQPSN